MADYEFKPLSQSNVVVTGGSRDIGGGIVLELSKAGAQVMAVFRSHVERAQKIVDEVRAGKGKEPILVQADLVTQAGQETVFGSWKEKFGNDIDVLVLCASGATMEINVDANMALVDKYLGLRKERLKRGEKLSGGTIIFLQSEPGHFHRVIDGVFDFLEYYRTKVGPAKRAGEDALRKRMAAMKDVGARGIVVCPPEVTDTFNMKLFELQEKQARDKSRELSAMLGTKAFVTIEEVAKKVREKIEDKTTPNNHTELFGGVVDSLTILNSIYGEEAVYVATFQKVDESRGVGRIIVNPEIWKRAEEPTFVGKVTSKTDTSSVSELPVAQAHMRGHFREDLAYILPGHKSVRTASLALGGFLGDGNYQLRKYASVKFRAPVVPGRTLITKVTIAESSKGTAKGDAVQSVDGKESMDIRGMVVERLKNSEESVLLLDQLIEAAAQTVGMQVLAGLEGEELLPLFHSTGEAEILINVKAGENLLVKAEKVRVVESGAMKIFSGDLEIVRATVETVTENGEKTAKLTKEEKVATIKSLQGLLLPKEEVLKKLK
jgi:NAD(P)-dependent dehydrogenase (short-subunit alcohol dehydrogenase family)/3-hydroxymyristoyl/3-hydroxydecanoyl-(acyl carrier protein) dehydratase